MVNKTTEQQTKVSVVLSSVEPYTRCFTRSHSTSSFQPTESQGIRCYKQFYAINIIQLFTFVEVNIRIYRSKIYDIHKEKS